MPLTLSDQQEWVKLLVLSTFFSNFDTFMYNYLNLTIVEFLPTFTKKKTPNFPQMIEGPIHERAIFYTNI